MFLNIVKTHVLLTVTCPSRHRSRGAGTDLPGALPCFLMPPSHSPSCHFDPFFDGNQNNLKNKSDRLQYCDGSLPSPGRHSPLRCPGGHAARRTPPTPPTVPRAPETGLPQGPSVWSSVPPSIPRCHSPAHPRTRARVASSGSPSSLAPPGHVAPPAHGAPGPWASPFAALIMAALVERVHGTRLSH